VLLFYYLITFLTNIMLDFREFDQIIVVGDRLLIQPRSSESQTKSGLFLPPGVEEQEVVSSGYVIKVGPGYAVPSDKEQEPWEEPSESVRYVPLQAKPGDLAVYLRKHAIEVQFNDKTYVVLPQTSILLLYRDEGLLSS
jgi:co-chaperonin GroES (HSP10)